MLTTGQIMNVLGIFLEMVSIYIIAQGIPKNKLDYLMKQGGSYFKKYEQERIEKIITVVALTVGGLFQIIATLIP